MLQVVLYKSTRNQYMLESPDMVLQGVYSGSNKVSILRMLA